MPLPHNPPGDLAQSDNSSPALLEQLTAHILQQPQRRITFADYMAWALYHPHHGYYTSRIPMGERGDYVTSSSFGPDFGELLAEQLLQLWQSLGSPTPFTLVEQGAGQGLLAADILTYLRHNHFDCFEALEYIVIERSPQLMADQRRRLAAALSAESGSGWDGLRWRTWSDIPENALVGCVFSNELVDAFPVHRVRVVGGKLQEVYVTVSGSSDDTGSSDSADGRDGGGGSDGAGSSDGIGSRLAEVAGDLSTPALQQYFERLNLSFEGYPDGYTTEVNLAALDWLQTVSNRLKAGYLLTVDYGHTAARYYHPTRPGTLQCYYRHAHHSDPYRNLGRQDITAHVDFTTLQRWGERCGLGTVGFTQQGLFLMALGLGDRLNELSQNSDRSINEIIRRRDALHALINPMGLGNFGVLIQGKGLPEGVPLPQGLRVP